MTRWTSKAFERALAKQREKDRAETQRAAVRHVAIQEAEAVLRSAEMDAVEYVISIGRLSSNTYAGMICAALKLSASQLSKLCGHAQSRVSRRGRTSAARYWPRAS